MTRRLGVEFKACGHFDLEVGRIIGVAARFEHLLYRDFLRNNLVKVGEETVLLAGIQFQGRKTSEKWKLSTMTPTSFEKAPALTMFIPQAARAPATSANRRVRSRVMTVSRKAGARTQVKLDGILVKIQAIWKWLRMCSGRRVCR